MLRIILLRHAKAERDKGQGDHARALAARGHSDALALGRWLEQNFLLPDQILVSDALRTRETYAQMASGSRSIAEVEPIFSNQLYNATADRLLDAIRSAQVPGRCLMLIAHNPAIAELAMRLPRFGDVQARRHIAERFSPGALAVIDFDTTHWREIAEHTGRLDAFIEPERYSEPSG